VRIDDEITTTSQVSISDIVSQVSSSSAAESEDNESDTEHISVAKAEVLRVLNTVKVFLRATRQLKNVFRN